MARNVADFARKDCNGCEVCGDICPAGAVSFVPDELTGFMYPAVDAGKCTACGLCVRHCPQNSPVRRENVFPEAEVWAMWSNDDGTRLLCTSGGIFRELGRKAVSLGGAVVACSYTEDFRGAYHTIALTEDELVPLCGSKYVQSSTEGIYRRVRGLLGEYTPVLFVGTPCQVAGLYSFLGDDPDNLITADFICNSINSPKSQAKYIEYLEDEYGARCVFSRAKDKRHGWNNFGSSAKFANGKEYYAPRNEDARVVAYHSGHLFIRDSCLGCQYKTLPRNADITLADFWGIEPDERNPKLELGTSAVMANSKKGADFLAALGESVSGYRKTLADVLRGNGNLTHNVTRSNRSMEAFRALDTMRFDRVVDRYRTRPGLLQRVKSRIRRVIKRLTGRG
ncbi:MAG: Coenzyme F420 hydrogenase/dehydrogenase, beta subunit C-terminal domain [Synergistaceae bacterium]|nr:Coenzyme F420 hydrogenase/dehydrogenase, beta subunit C-terminal domain [Synergistaceae bacterium]